jgi:hypothetical protein
MPRDSPGVGATEERNGLMQGSRHTHSLTFQVGTLRTLHRTYQAPVEPEWSVQIPPLQAGPCQKKGMPK